MKNIGFGIIGSGGISSHHIRAIADARGGELIGIYSLDRRSAAALALEHSVRLFESVDEMIDCREIEAVCLCTPSGTHADIAERLLLSGKHVLVEKPIALTSDDAMRVCLAAERGGALCSAVSQLRFFDSVQAIKRAIDGGLLGRLTFVSAYMKYYRSPEYYSSAPWRGRWDTDGGLLMNQGIHGIDLLRYLAGEVCAVSAAGRTLLHSIEADDTTAALLEFESGALGIVEGTTSVYPGYDLAIELCGTRGSIRLEGDKIARWDADEPPLIDSQAENGSRSGSDPSAISHAGHTLQIENLIRAIGGEEALVSDCHSGRRTVELINAIYRAAGEMKRITLIQGKEEANGADKKD